MIANLHMWQEVQYNEASRVIAFTQVVSDGEGTRCPSRINVYYTTRCVGTVIQHPRRERRTQMFRKNCTYEEMEAIFINPRVHTGKGYYERENVPAVATRRAEEVDREEANCIADCLRLELQDVEGHIAEMTACRDEFKRRLNAIEQAERKRQEAEAEKKRQAERVEAEKKRQAAEKKRQEEQKALRRERGLYAHAYTFHNEDVNENFDESVSCIAMGDRATLMVYDHGGYSYTEGMPTGLYNKLHHRGANQPKPTYVAMGSMDRWYVRYDSGVSQWNNVPKSLTDAINENPTVPVCLAFGRVHNSYCVLWSDGTWSWCNVPAKLENVLGYKGRDKSAPKFVSLGPNGEYFVRLENGKMWWGNFDDESIYDNDMSDRITSIHFGADGTYIARYT